MAIVLPGTTGVTTMAGIIGKVKVIGVGARNTIALVALVVIPADKVNRVTKIIAVCTTTASVVLVPLPGAFQCLWITVGIGGAFPGNKAEQRSEEHTSELQSRENLVCRLLLEKKKKLNR